MLSLDVLYDMVADLTGWHVDTLTVHFSRKQLATGRKYVARIAMCGTDSAGAVLELDGVGYTLEEALKAVIRGASRRIAASRNWWQSRLDNANRVAGKLNLAEMEGAQEEKRCSCTGEKECDAIDGPCACGKCHHADEPREG